MNTPLQDQQYLRQQILDYLLHCEAGTRLAIFTLSSQLSMISDFSEDPAQLRTALLAHGVVRASPLLASNTSATATVQARDRLRSFSQDDPSGRAEASFQQLQSFLEEQDRSQVGERAAMTLSALTTLGKYLQQLPGRKNILWFSGAFPLHLYTSDRSSHASNAVDRDFEAATKAAAAALTAARAAIYAIDPRGLQTSTFYDVASTGGNGSVPESVRQSLALRQENMQRDAEHGAMQELSESTGGKAYFETNDLGDAIRRATAEGAHFYTLTYTPSDRTEDGRFRSITVRLRKGVKGTLSYRHGYYASTSDSSSSQQGLQAAH